MLLLSTNIISLGKLAGGDGNSIDGDGSLDENYKLGVSNNDDNNSLYTGSLINSDSRVSFTGLPFRGRHIYINTINIKHPEEHKWLQSHSHYILSFLNR